MRTGQILFGFLPTAGLAVMAGSVSQAKQSAKKPGDSRVVFERRILPVLRSSNPSTCSECHLSGVDLKQYIRTTESATFAAMKKQGLINSERPEDSHLLRLIKMSRPQSPLLTQKAREQEYEAFRAWIVAAAQNPQLKTAKSEARIGPNISNAVLRHTRLDRVTASFVRNIWSQEGRCMGCHRPGEGSAANVKKYGNRVLWFVPDDPEATMQKILAQGLVNLQTPEQSLLLLKPLNKVPHGGGVKMLVGDTSYQMFRSWIEDYAQSKRGGYRKTADLPATPKEALAYTECLLHVSDAPKTWIDKNLRVDIFAFDAKSNRFAEYPLATAERQISPNRDTNLLIFRIVPAGTEKNAPPRLASGRYLLKYYVDTTGKSAGDYRIPTNTASFYQGKQEMTSAWKPGWGEITNLRVSLQQ